MSQTRILIVDDEPSVRNMCVRALALEGYDTVGVSSGAAAVTRVRAEPFDLFITDLKMPGVDGLELCRVVQGLAPEMPMIVMTGYGTMESAIQALRLGVSEFILKPFRPDELNAVVTRALDRRRMEIENVRLKALIPILDLSRVFISSVDPTNILKHVVRIARNELGADRVSLMLLTPDGKLAIRAAEGLPEQALSQPHQNAHDGVAGLVLSSREPMVLQGDLEADPRFRSRPQRASVSSAISLPLVHKDQTLGVLNVSRTHGGTRFTEADVELLSVLASQAAIAIENARLFQEIQDAYQRLAELDHLKSEFISIASHELRAPLAILLAYASIVEAEISGPSRDHLAQIVESAMQLKSIIDEMVSLRRIDASETQINIADVDAAAIVTAVVDESAPLARRKALELVVDMPDDLGSVRADASVARLILSSLLANAIKFTPEGGSIRVSARVGGDQIVIAVSDTGVGIPAEQLGRIFERFYQVEDSLRREHGGIGLGLAIAKEMADLIDGRIRVESKVGKGSTFYLDLRRSE